MYIFRKINIIIYIEQVWGRDYNPHPHPTSTVVFFLALSQPQLPFIQEFSQLGTGPHIIGDGEANFHP